MIMNIYYLFTDKINGILAVHLVTSQWKDIEFEIQSVIL